MIDTRVNLTLWHDSEMACFKRTFVFVTHAEPHVLHTKTKVTISRCKFLSQLIEIIQQKHAKFGANKAWRMNQLDAE